MEIGTVVSAMYEDKALGKIPDHRFQLMTEKYDAETGRLQCEIEEIERYFKAADEQEINTEMFIDVIRQYKDIRKLTPQIVSDLIEKIVVGERRKVNVNWTQQFDIYYRFIGLI